MIYSEQITHTHMHISENTHTCTYVQMHTHACMHTLFGNKHEEEARDFLCLVRGKQKTVACLFPGPSPLFPQVPDFYTCPTLDVFLTKWQETNNCLTGEDKDEEAGPAVTG